VCVFDVVNESEAKNETHTVQIKQNDLNFVLVLLSIIAVMAMFTESMFIPALPTLQAEFRTTATWTSWILSIYLVAGAVSMPIVGKLGDMYRKKKILVLFEPLYHWSNLERVCLEYPELDIFLERCRA
jgi:predicted MFS family arabinose efflux permease